VEKFVLKDKTFTEVAVVLVKEIILSYLQLPHELQKMARKLNEGNVSIRVRELPAHTRQLYVLGHQMLYGIFGVAAFFLSGWCKSIGLETYANYSLYGGIFFGVVLVGSIFRNRI